MGDRKYDEALYCRHENFNLWVTRHPSVRQMRLAFVNKYADKEGFISTFFGNIMLFFSTFGNIMVLFALMSENRNDVIRDFLRQYYSSQLGSIMSKVTWGDTRSIRLPFWQSYASFSVQKNF
jgi:hypothetical protein